MENGVNDVMQVTREREEREGEEGVVCLRVSLWRLIQWANDVALLKRSSWRVTKSQIT